MDLKGAEIRNIYELCLGIGERTGAKLRINIPYYQRPYRWQNTHIENLINDFFKNIGNVEQAGYFLGSIVTVKKDQSTNEYHDIIDGQQRITTVYLLNYLKFLMLRAYIEELIILGKDVRLNEYLGKLVDCYSKIVGINNADKLQEMHEKIINTLELISELQGAEKEEKYDELTKYYQMTVGLPEKNLNNIDNYINEYNIGLYNFLKREEFSLKYSRTSLNEKLREALGKVYIELSDDHGPVFNIINEEEINDAIVKQYTNALKCIFDSIYKLVDSENKKPFEIALEMLNKIDNMLLNLKFCVIVTGNEKDAYTLFEVLNDRALEVDDLDLIKNLFFKEYCNKSSDNELVIDNNIENLDDIWGNEIFTQDIGIKQTKMIAYLGTLYLTSDENVFTNQVQRYREIIEEMYLNEIYYNNGKKYEYLNVKNDFRIFQAVKIFIEEFSLPFQNLSLAAINAVNSLGTSITYKTVHLINALKYDGVMPALTNIILKTFIHKYAEDGGKEINPIIFKDFINRLKNDAESNTDELNILAAGNLDSGNMGTGLPVDGNHLNSA